MRALPYILINFIFTVFETINAQQVNYEEMSYTETEILKELDLAFTQTPSSFFPKSQPNDIKYNFFLDLENGYCEIASSLIHLYADSLRWAIVFETCGYETRNSNAEITLNYIGNCIYYPIDKYQGRNYITNSNRVILIEPDEFKRIENKNGDDMEIFELIEENTKKIKIRDTIIDFENDYKKYEALGIQIQDNDNPNKLIGFGDLIRYINETNPKLIYATENDIKRNIPDDLQKIMTIKDFHFVSLYNNENRPSQQETFKLITEILVKKDTSIWKPNKKANNHWTNWVSGNL